MQHREHHIINLFFHEIEMKSRIANKLVRALCATATSKTQSLAEMNLQSSATLVLPVPCLLIGE